MSGLKVQCPNCKRKDFVTTDRFDPDVTPNGGMVKCLLPYQIDWLCSSSTLCAQMTCPECLAPLAPQRVLNVLYPVREAGGFFKFHVQANDLGIVPHGDQLHVDGDNVLLVKDENIEIKPNVGKPAHICEVCGKECSTALALSGHKRSHKDK